MPGQRGVSLRHFTINLTLLDHLAGDVDDGAVRLAVIDALRRRGACGIAGFEVTVSEQPVTVRAEREPAALERAPGHPAFDAIEHAWSIAAKAVVHARIAERGGPDGSPPDGQSAPGTALETATSRFRRGRKKGGVDAYAGRGRIEREGVRPR
jgi:hypothetical protein